MASFTKQLEQAFQISPAVLVLCMKNVQKQNTQYVLPIYLNVTALSIVARQLLDFLVKRPKTLGVFIVME